MRKLLTFSKDGERVRVLWSDGICKTPAALEKVMNGGYAWDTIKTSGDTTPKPSLKFVSKKMDANNPAFLGLQNPPKAVPKPVEKNEDGTDKPAKRGRAPKQAVNPDLLQDMMKQAEAGKTLKEAAEALGLSYPFLYLTAKKEKIAFKAGQRGRKKGVKVDKPAEA